MMTWTGCWERGGRCWQKRTVIRPRPLIPQTSTLGEIGYKDKEGQERSILLSNFKDRSMEHPFGYCIEKFPDHDRREVYARDVISPVIPAVCWQP